MVGLPVSIGVMTQCRQGDLPYVAGTPLEESYRVAEQVVARYADRYTIKNYEADFEQAYEGGITILIEPNGTTGNQVIRTLYFLGVVRFFGAPYMDAKHVVVETFRSSADFPDVLMLAAALSNCRDEGVAP
jgi:predicted methyltransferase MtxX (methanogen marker protein 4)